MKKFYLFLMLLSMITMANAQYIYNDFDANQNETFVGWPNNPSIIANPNSTGLNTSANVAEWQRTTEQWAHVFCTLDGKIDFSTVTEFEMKVQVPVPCTILFKLEDKLNGGVFTELSTNVATVNQWVQLNFDFAGAQSGLYDKIVIFFDFSQTNDNLFYFDEITGPSYAGGNPAKPLLALNVQDNFENTGWGTITTWKFQDPNMDDLPVVTDPANAANHVAEYNRSGSFEWTNAQFVLDHRMDLSSRNKFDVKVYFPSSNNYTGSLTPTAAMKLQNSLLGGNAWSTQTEIKQTITQFDQWVSLVFDFSAVADSVNYDQVVVQFGGEGHFTPGMFYFDDLALEGSVGIDRMNQNTTVYPNPVTNTLFLANNLKHQEISIYSISGQRMIHSDNLSNSIDVSNLPNGIYTIRIITIDKQSLVTRFVKK
ncbi:MAG: T9SS type A sorting domain-containing protein [Bacteroidales bacterium]|nr:T9SS type A sorting domain-containing protein [Bacteroidales bacterium]